MVATSKFNLLKQFAQRRANPAPAPSGPAAQPRDAKGRWTKGAKSLASQHQEKIKDAIVNTGGVVGSVIGGRMAGPAGALAGDLIGAMVARKAVHVATVAHSAHEKLQRDEGFARASRLAQLKKLGAATLSDLKSEAVQEQLASDMTGDISGWAIGNASAKVIGAMIPASAGVPLKGAVVAMATVPKIVKLRQKLKQRNAGAG